MKRTGAYNGKRWLNCVRDNGVLDYRNISQVTDYTGSPGRIRNHDKMPGISAFSSAALQTDTPNFSPADDWLSRTLLDFPGRSKVEKNLLPLISLDWIHLWSTSKVFDQIFWPSGSSALLQELAGRA